MSLCWTIEISYNSSLHNINASVSKRSYEEIDKSCMKVLKLEMYRKTNSIFKKIRHRNVKLRNMYLSIIYVKMIGNFNINLWFSLAELSWYLCYGGQSF